MASLVVDTDVVSFLYKQDSRAALYWPHLTGHILVISFMAVAELHRWALKSNWGPRRRAALQAHLQQFLTDPFDDALCVRWAEITVAAERQGLPISHADAWQAATALHHGIPLISHNRRHYVGVPGLVLISEAPA